MTRSITGDANTWLQAIFTCIHTTVNTVQVDALDLDGEESMPKLTVRSQGYVSMVYGFVGLLPTVLFHSYANVEASIC
jgi:hypothetical protein